MDIAYGIDVRSNEDPYIEAVRQGVISVGMAIAPGAFLVDTFPILKHVPSWVPGAGFKRRAKEWKIVADHMFDAPFEALKKSVVHSRSSINFGTVGYLH